MFLWSICRTVAPALLTVGVMAFLTLGFGLLSGTIVGHGYVTAAECASARHYPAAHPSPSAVVDDGVPPVRIQLATKGALR